MSLTWLAEKEVKIEYCPIYKIIVDYITKPLFSGKFKLFRNLIMNLSGKHHHIGKHECGRRNIQGQIINLVK